MDQKEIEIIAKGVNPKKYSNNIKGFYVYGLLNPIDNDVFYIGKGKGKRALHHVAENRSNNLVNAKKHEVITEIIKAGLEPDIIIIKSNMKEEEAYVLEAKIIKKNKTELTNYHFGQLTETERIILWSKNNLSRRIPYGKWLALRERTNKQTQLYKSLFSIQYLVAFKGHDLITANRLTNGRYKTN